MPALATSYTPSWFVRALFGEEERPKGHLVIFRDQKKDIYWISLQEAPAWLDTNTATLAGSDNLYVSVCAQDQPAALAEKARRIAHDASRKGKAAWRPSLKKIRGFSETASVVPALWFELDFRDAAAHKGEALPTREEAEQFIERLPLAPTLIVASGHGLHLYWVLERPHLVSTAAERSEISRLGERWQQMIRLRAEAQGWRLDSTHDLSRVLRPPGTLNHKTTPPKPVTVERYDVRRYALADFEQLLPAADAPQRRREPARVLDGSAAAVYAGGSYAGTYEVEDVRDMLRAISYRPGYREWLKIIAAVLDAVGGDLDTAEALLKEWRPEEEEGEYRLKLESGLNGTVSKGSLLWTARQNGYEGMEKAPVAYLGGRRAYEGDGAPGAPPDPETDVVRLTDMGNSRRFAQENRDALRYCHPWKDWLAWDGRRWKRDASGEVMRRAKHLVDLMHEEAQLMPEDERKPLAKWAGASESANRLTSMVRLAESELPVLPEELDAESDLLCVLNGTIDLVTGTFREHAREDLITKIAEVYYREAAVCPRWEKFVLEVLGGDAELAAYVQRLAGYSMTGSVAEQVLPIFYGSGANGKGTFMETLQEVLGDYAQTARSELLMARPAATGTASEDEAALKGARLVTASETQGKKRLSEAVVKRLTGGDTIRARFLHANSFEFHPTHKIWLATNHKPVIGDTDHAIWRRIHLVPFTQRFEGDRRDPNLKEKLRAERSGILNWMLAGCLAWRKEGLRPPAAVTDATQEYREEMDIIAAFIAECCDVEVPQAISIPASALYGEYVRWCERTGEHAENQRRFGIQLAERGIQKYTNDGVRYRGIQIKVKQVSGAPF